MIPVPFFSFPFSFLLTRLNAEASIGCPIPDLRFVRPRKFGSTTTEQPYVTFETTQIYLPDDFTTADFEYAENTDDESTETDDTKSATSNQRQTRYTDFNPYAWNPDGSSNSGASDDASHVPFGTIVGHESHDRHKNPNLNTKMERQKMMRKNAAGRRRLDRHHQSHKQQKREINDSSNDIYYIQSSDIVGQLHGNLNSIGSNHNRTITIDFMDENDRNNNEGVADELRKNYDEQLEDGVATAAHVDDVSQNGSDESPVMAEAIKTSSSNIAKNIGAKKQYRKDVGSDKDMVAKKKTSTTTNKKKIALQRTQNAPNERRVVSEINNNEKNDKNRQQNNTEGENDRNDSETADIVSKMGVEHRTTAHTSSIDNYYGFPGATDSKAPNFRDFLQRFKRKSGKATGALSRPKGGSESGTKNTSRKKDGKCFMEELYFIRNSARRFDGSSCRCVASIGTLQHLKTRASLSSGFGVNRPRVKFRKIENTIFSTNFEIWRLFRNPKILRSRLNYVSNDRIGSFFLAREFRCQFQNVVPHNFEWIIIIIILKPLPTVTRIAFSFGSYVKSRKKVATLDWNSTESILVSLIWNKYEKSGMRIRIKSTRKMAQE